MKQKKSLSLLLILFLTSCNLSNESSIGSKESSSSIIESSTSLEESSSSIEESSTSVEESSSSSKESSVDSSLIIKEDREVNLFGINDFHGSVVENDNEVGIVRLGSFLKEKGNEDNTLLINSGDMFQGSIESNYNYGELLTKCNNYIGFDCFTIGNHEFDWGATYINKNRNIYSSNYQTPFLAANIYNFDMSTKTTLDYADLGDEYTIQTLENGLKVGIIGVIGDDQIASISSQYTDEYSFEDPTPIVKRLSDKLRMEENCDVIILSGHASQWQLLEDDNEYGVDNSGLTTISNVSNKRYVDAIFCAHSHANEKELINGVPLVQASSNGRMYSNVKLVVSPEGNVTCSYYGNTYTSSISSTKYKDEGLMELVNEYKSVSDEVGNKLITYSKGKFSKSSSCIRLMNTAMYYEAKAQGFDVDYALSNNARADIPSGNIRYSTLYRAFPFDNEVYIVEASGKDILKEANYYGMYRANPYALVENKTYKVAVIDYLAFHRGASRNYDYMPSCKYVGKLTKDGSGIYGYRDVLADYLLSLSSNLYPDSYSEDNFNYDVSKIKEDM